MKFLKFCVLVFFTISLSSGCFKDKDDVLTIETTSKINDFIWRGMNFYYLYKADVKNLADNRFLKDKEYQNFLGGFDTPEDFFESLKSNVDEFSFLVDDYIKLEQSFDGITKNNGMEYGLFFYPNSETNVYGFVRYVLPSTDAEAKGIKRGMIFNTVDGVQINDQNFRDLLAPEVYTIGLATIDSTTVTPTQKSIKLIKTQYTENPVFIAKTLNIKGKSIGYLLYNAFNTSFEPQLNEAFAKFKSDGVTELILDVRYNGGGSVETAKDLSSMITGQFKGKVFSTEKWNIKIQESINNNAPERLINRFDDKISNGTAINSLALNQVYILTTRSSASASELIINCLDPYIKVKQVGTTTRGKFQASITLYDSKNFRRQRANLGHTYAMQPLVLKSMNSVGFTDYFTGFVPEIEINESASNPGILGEATEPLLKAAIDDIFSQKSFKKNNNLTDKQIGDSNMFDPNYQRMYKIAL